MKNYIINNYSYRHTPFLLNAAFILSFIFFYSSSSGKAQNSLSGLYQNYNAVQTSPPNEIIAGRNRLRLQINRSQSFGGFYAETDVIQSYSENPDVELIIKEAYADIYFDKSDLRVGLQKISWGRADAGFVIDILSQLDLREFLTLGPDDLRLGITALNYTRYFGANSFQLIASPIFQPDRIPKPGSRWYPVPEISTPLPVNISQYEAETGIDNVQLAFRYGLRSPANLDLDLYALLWTHPMPAYDIDLEFLDLPNVLSVTLNETYKQSLMGGVSASYQLHQYFTFIGEMLYVKDRLFTYLPIQTEQLENAISSPVSALQVFQEFAFNDINFLEKSSWLNSMFGIKSEVKGVNISAQVYLETILNYDDRFLQDEQFTYFSLLLNRAFLRQRLQAIFLGRYNQNGDDFWTQIQGIYEIDDGLEISFGVNLFGGRERDTFYGHFSFDQFSDNSFIFSKIAVYF